MLHELKNDELVSKTKSLVSEEKRLGAEILVHLREIERRRLFAELGYGSLHEFAITHLGYSEGAAHRRISAMRLLRDLPEVKDSIESGKLSLSTASQLHGFFQAEKRERQKEYPLPEKRALLQELQGRSKREIEMRLAELSPQAIPQERERVLTPELTEIRLVMTAQLEAKLKKVASPHVAPRSPEL